jgi:hypothetical protein
MCRERGRARVGGGLFDARIEVGCLKTLETAALFVDDFRELGDSEATASDRFEFGEQLVRRDRPLL